MNLIPASDHLGRRRQQSPITFTIKFLQVAKKMPHRHVSQVVLFKNAAAKIDSKNFPKEKQVKSINGAQLVIHVPNSGSDEQRRNEDQVGKDTEKYLLRYSISSRKNY